MDFSHINILAPQLLTIAYLDPGSGSIILQLVLAGLLGAGVLVKVFWRKIKALFGRAEPKKEDDSQLQP